MKKNLALIISALMIFALAFTGCSKKDDNAKLTTVKLNEVVRSVFYAPMYVAITEGFFEEEGIKIDLSTGQGADATPSKTQVLELFLFT